MLYPVELSIQSTTVVKFGDLFNAEEIAQEDPEPVPFLGLATADGTVRKFTLYSILPRNNEITICNTQ